jgi:cytochrome d ubiquinol oxidase subunit II
MALPTIFFILSVVAFAAWSVLDGFDLGVGFLLPLFRDRKDRSAAIAAIGPVWNGNEVWLIAGIGSLLVCFPPVYAALLSGLYLPSILLLLSIVGRGVGLEFRGRVKTDAARAACEAIFAIGSALVAFLVGVVAANVLRGLPIGADGAMVKPLLRPFSPYALVTGLASLLGFALHGAAWLALKTDEPVRGRARKLFAFLMPALLLLAAASLALGAFAAPSAMPWGAGKSLTWALAALAVGSGVAAMACQMRRARLGAFLGTSAMIALTVAWLASSLYPALVPSSIDPAYGLTVSNAAVGQSSLRTLAVLAAIGVPVALLAHILLYRIFRGGTKEHEEEY